MRPEYYSDLFRRYSVYCRNYDGNELYKIASGASDYDYNWTKVYNEDGTVKAEWKPDGGDFEYPFCRKYIDPKFDGDVNVSIIYYNELFWLNLMKNTTSIFII